MKIGYARVSRETQHLERQLDALKDCERIYQEKITGAGKVRPELERMLDTLREGDKVIVSDFTRLGRSTRDLMDIMQRIRDAGAEIVSLKENFDTSSAIGRMMMNFVIILADFERSILLERTREGLAAARARGRCGGRKPIDSRKVKDALTLYDSKQYTLREITERTGVKRSTLYRYIQKRTASQTDG